MRNINKTLTFIALTATLNFIFCAPSQAVAFPDIDYASHDSGRLLLTAPKDYETQLITVPKKIFDKKLKVTLNRVDSVDLKYRYLSASSDKFLGDLPEGLARLTAQDLTKDTNPSVDGVKVTEMTSGFPLENAYPLLQGVKAKDEIPPVKLALIAKTDKKQAYYGTEKELLATKTVKIGSAIRLINPAENRKIEVSLRNHL